MKSYVNIAKTATGKSQLAKDMIQKVSIDVHEQKTASSRKGRKYKPTNCQKRHDISSICVRESKP